MDAVYQRIVEVRLWHDYFLDPTETGVPAVSPRLYRVNNFIRLLPVPGMLEEMRKNRFFFRTTDLGFDLIAEIREGNPPSTFFTLRRPLKFTFLLLLEDPLFSNYTSLPLESNAGAIYYFNNIEVSAIAGNPELFLSSALLAYNPTLSYQLGDVVRANDKAFEVTIFPQIDPPSDLSDQWAAGKNSQYVSKLDQIRQVGRFLNYQESNSATLQGQEVDFIVRDVFGRRQRLGIRSIPGEDPPVPIEKTRFPDELERDLVHQLDLQILQLGYYTLELGNDLIGYRLVDQFFKIDDRSIQSAWGILELIHIPPGLDTPVNVSPESTFVTNTTNDGRLVTSISPKVFTLHFKNRPTFWRYRSALDKTPIGDELGPLPLTKAYQLVGSESSPLPNPTPNFLDRVVNANGAIEKVYSNVYLPD